MQSASGYALRGVHRKQQTHDLMHNDHKGGQQNRRIRYTYPQLPEQKAVKAPGQNSTGTPGQISTGADSYRNQRARHVQSTPEAPFFVSTRGRLLGQALSDRQVHRIFEHLRGKLGWVDRGAHGAPRIHDLRHSFAVRRLVLWHEQGEDMHQGMLALSTYLGHAKVSNTYWYLTGVPELMNLAGKRFEHFAELGEDGDE
jgi:integrase